MKRLLLALLVTAPGLVALPAHAQGVDEFGTYGERMSRESKQNMAIELRIGRYVPSIDEEFDRSQPYRTVFGTKNRYSIGFEVDWQALRIPYLGTLGPGFGIAYTKMSGQGFQTNDPTQRAQEDTSLTIVPLHALAVLRADYLARETPVPLVPYVKLGLGGALWAVGNGDGTASSGGKIGRGVSYGPTFALGAMFLLDPFDPTAAKEIDETMGINNSYVYLEWYVSKLNGFGAADQMQVGTNTWVLGLAVEL